MKKHYLFSICMISILFFFAACSSPKNEAKIYLDAIIKADVEQILGSEEFGELTAEEIELIAGILDELKTSEFYPASYKILEEKKIDKNKYEFQVEIVANNGTTFTAPLVLSKIDGKWKTIVSPLDNMPRNYDEDYLEDDGTSDEDAWD